MKVSVDQNLREFFNDLSPEAIDAKVERALKSAGIDLAGEASERLKKKTKRGGGSTGDLSRNIASEVDGTTLKVGSLKSSPGGGPLPYAKIRDLGGVIKGNPWLAIPIKDGLKKGKATNVTKSGVMSGLTAREVKNSPSRFGFEGTFIVKGSRSPLVVMASLGGGVAVPIFALKKSVKQDGYFYLTDTMKKEGQDTVIDYLKEEFEDE